MTAAENGWRPGEDAERPEFGYLGDTPQLRTPISELVDQGLKQIAEKLPEEDKEGAHREIEVSRMLTAEEEQKAKDLLELQGAKVVKKAEIEQVWYDTEEVCGSIDTSTSLTSGSLYVCHSMQIRVRSIKTDNGEEYHWGIKLPGVNDAERLEFEGVEETWGAALKKLNEKIAVIVNFDGFHETVLAPITKESKIKNAVKKTRTSYKYKDQPPGGGFPCTGSQMDFDEWTEINGHKGEPVLDADGKPTGKIKPLLITVDVEGKTLNGDAEGLTEDEARKIPSVENCVWCLSLPGGDYKLFEMIAEKWPRK